jgi:hypothetical protein
MLWYSSPQRQSRFARAAIRAFSGRGKRRLGRKG